MFSIITVNYHTADWIQMMLDSLSRTTDEFPEIIIVDNSKNLPLFPDYPMVKVITPEKNIGHGAGLDLAVQHTRADYVLAMDSDAHFLRSGWEEDLLEEFAGDKVKIVAAEGGPLKPFRPCVMAFERKHFVDNGHSFQNVPVKCDGGFLTIDVGVFFAMRTLHDSFAVTPIRYGKEFYEGSSGDTYYLADQPTFYHNFYGARFNGNDKIIDGIKLEDHEAHKKIVFDKFYHKTNG